MSNVLFEDIFEVSNIDIEGKKFERVSRLHCGGEFFKMSLILDINSHIYPMGVGDKFRLVAVSSEGEDEHYTREDWDPQCGGETPSGSQSPGQKRSFDYVMYGRIYRIEETTKMEDKQSMAHLAVYVSFGGLLMRLEGDHKSLRCFGVDEKIFLLINKIPL